MTVLRQYNTGTATWDVFVSGSPGDWSTAQSILTVSTNRLLDSTDAGKLLVNGGSYKITVDDSTGLSPGQRIDLLRTNSGTFTVGRASSNIASTNLYIADKTANTDTTLRVQYSSATILCTAANTYVLMGDIS